MTNIFISYKREEKAPARQLADLLEAEGWSVWWDAKLQAGERFEKAIEKALDASELVIVLWSPLSVDSDFILDEAGWARDQGKLMPIMIEPTRLPLRFRGLHTLDLVAWGGSSSFPAFLALVAQITERIGPANPAVETRFPARADWSARQSGAGDEGAELLTELGDSARTHQRRAEVGDQLATTRIEKLSRKDRVLEIRRKRQAKEEAIQEAVQDVLSLIDELGPMTPEELASISPITIQELEDMGVIYFDGGQWNKKRDLTLADVS